MRDDRVFGDDDDAVADEVFFVIHVFRLASGRDGDVVPDARIFINDGILNLAVRADAQARQAGLFMPLDGFMRFVVIAAEGDDAVQFRAVLDDGAQADDAAGDAGVIDDAAVGDDGVVNLRAVDLGAGQEARTGKNRRAHVEEIEARQFGSQLQVCLEEVADRPDVLPIALINIGENAVRVDGVRDDVLAEIGQRIVEQALDEAAVENIDAHRGEVGFTPGFQAELLVQFRRHLERIQQRRLLGLLDEPVDAVLGIHLHDAAGHRFRAPDRQHGDGDVRLVRRMFLDQFAQVHPIQLVAAQDEQVVEVMVHEVDEVFAHRVRRAFIPRGIRERLLRRENLHEPGGKLVELIRPRNVAVQRGGVKLRQDVDAAEPGIDAVRDRDVHDAVFAGERHGRLGAVFSERKQSRPLAAAHDDTQHLADVERLPARLRHK